MRTQIRHEVEIISLASLRRNISPKNSRFISDVFTPGEQRYCRSNRMLLEHYGARLAAKRAVLKVLGLKVSDRKLLRSVEIRKSGNGQPYIQWPAGFYKRHRLPPGLLVQISLTHERKFAAACALAVFP